MRRKNVMSKMMENTWRKPGYMYRQKKIGKFIIELYSTRYMGGDIVIWIPIKYLDKDFVKNPKYSDDRKYFYIDKFYIANFEPAYEKYVSLYDNRQIKSIINDFVGGYYL